GIRSPAGLHRAVRPRVGRADRAFVYCGWNTTPRAAFGLYVPLTIGRRLGRLVIGTVPGLGFWGRDHPGEEVLRARPRELDIQYRAEDACDYHLNDHAAGARIQIRVRHGWSHQA